MKLEYLVCAVLVLSGCFAELNAGYYKTSGGSQEKEFIIGLNAGLYLEYARFVRVAAGGDAQLPLGKGAVYQRGYGTTVKGDLTVIGDPKTRVRVGGAMTFGLDGSTRHEPMEGGPVTRGDAKIGGWWAGIGIESTHIPTRVTQSYMIGPHFMTATSDILGDVEMKGVQLRINHTFWPTWRRVSPGFFASMFNMMANSKTSGTGDGSDPSQGPRGACYETTDCSMAIGGGRCRVYSFCN